ncbi:MAG: MgtC/SapB family protein [Gemmatimonadales bacterium]
MFALALQLGVAALVGLAVGLEREWSGHARGPGARFAGIRTFLILGFLGGVAGALGSEGLWSVAAVLLGGGVLLVVAAYVMAARRTAEDVDGTTEAAALLVLGLAMLAGLGWLRVASGVTAVTVLALSEKSAIRSLVGRLSDEEVRGAAQFAVLALVVLPLLPAGPFGPFDAIEPRTLWIIVLLISAINYVGYVARRALGGARGYVITGALGGLVSSTAVTLSFARRSRQEEDNAAALAQGTVAACAVLLPRVIAVAAAVNPAFVPRAGLLLAPVAVVALALILFGRSSATEEPAELGAKSPLQLGQALKLALAFQVVLLVLEFARFQFGGLGVITGAAVIGLTDVDALTLTMARMAVAETSELTAAVALVVGVMSNTVVKAGIAAFLGSPAYRRWTVPGLLAMALAGLAGIWLFGR